MKALKIFCLLMFIGITFQAAQAQNTKKDNGAAQQAAIKKLVEGKAYNFAAQSANPLRGGTIQLSYGYHLQLNKDTIKADLPYFGRAYVAPMDPTENGLEFTSTKFTYKYVLSKNGYEVSIKPIDTKNVRLIYLEISSGGFTTLRIASLNREPISFLGYLEAIKEPKKDKPTE